MMAYVTLNGTVRFVVVHQSNAWRLEGIVEGDLARKNIQGGFRLVRTW